jgi:hypothetical protein
MAGGIGKIDKERQRGVLVRIIGADGQTVPRVAYRDTYCTRRQRWRKVGDREGGRKSVTCLGLWRLVRSWLSLSVIGFDKDDCG